MTIPRRITILRIKARRMLLSWETTDTVTDYSDTFDTADDSLAYQKYLLNAFTRSRLSGHLRIAISKAFYIFHSLAFLGLCYHLGPLLHLSDLLPSNYVIGEKTPFLTALIGVEKSVSVVSLSGSVVSVVALSWYTRVHD